MVSTTAKKWLTGCGIGCALAIVIAIALVVSVVYFVRGKVQPLQQASESHKAIVAATGEANAFVPPADGAIGAERMEVFLSVRDSLKDTQTRLDAALANFDFERLSQGQRSFGDALRTLNDVGNLLGPIGEYITRRNGILLSKHMGLGEHAYIYSIAYHSWLGHAPEEGPRLVEMARHRSRDHFETNDSGLDPESVHQQYRRLMLRLLGNQMEGIGGADATTRAALKQEIDRMRNDSDRVAWQDNLPQAVEESLKPYRRRLEEDFHASTNYFELLTTEEFNRVQWNGSFSRGVESGTRPPVEAPETKRAPMK